LQIIQAIFDDRKELAIAQELTISVHGAQSFGAPVSKARRQQPRRTCSFCFV
jgi:hypothetical protein